MWIMLIKKLPTEPSPPKLSLFWSTPWPPEGPVGKNAVREWKTLSGQPGDPWVSEHGMFQNWRWGYGTPQTPDPLRLPNWAEARKIRYGGCDIRVFPHEYGTMTAETMNEYVVGGSHVLESGDVAEDMIVSSILRGVRLPIYESALLAGCTHAQAVAVAMGMDITLPDVIFPAIGWYRCAPAYAAMLCDPWEMEG